MAIYTIFIHSVLSADYRYFIYKKVKEKGGKWGIGEEKYKQFIIFPFYFNFFLSNSTRLTSIAKSAKLTNKPVSLFIAFKYDLTCA